MAATRVLLVSSNFPPVTGGAATVYDNICKFSDRAVLALAASHDYANGLPLAGADAFDRAADYSIDRLPLLRPLASSQSKIQDLTLMAKVLSKIVKIARRNEAKVICLGDLVYNGWLIFPLKYLFGYKVAVYVHGEEITAEDGGGLFDSWRSKFLSHADSIIAVSQFTVDALIGRMQADRAKISLLSNGVDGARFQARSPSPGAAAHYGVEGRRVVLSVGRLVARKGMDRLIQAMPSVLEACPQAHLLIAGEGPFRPVLEGLIEANGLAGRVTILGSVSQDALSELYALAEVFALPNREMPDGDTEGFGLVFLEANACGKPVVSGRAGGAVDAVTDGVNGLTVDGEDVASIAGAVERLLIDPHLSRKLAEGGIARAASSDWRNRSAAFLSICSALTAARYDAKTRAF